MRFKKIGAALLACAMCFGVFSTTAFAYVGQGQQPRQQILPKKRTTPFPAPGC